MKIKRMVISAQQKLAHVLPEQLRCQQQGMKGWPGVGGQDKTVMWQPTCWPSAGKAPRAAQKLFQR